MSIQTLKPGQTCLLKAPLTAYTGLMCPKHKVPMTATLEVPAKAKVKKISDKLYTASSAYVKSVRHPGASCSLGVGPEGGRKFVPRSSMIYGTPGLRIMTDSSLASASKWGATAVVFPEVKKPEVKPEVKPVKKEVKKPVVKKEVEPKAKPVKKEPEVKKEVKKEAVKKPEVKPVEVKPAPAKKEKKASKKKGKRKASPPPEVDENLMDKFFGETEATPSSRKNNVA